MRLDDAALLADPVLAQLDPGLGSVLNVNTPDDYRAARQRPAPEVTVQLFGALAKAGRPGGPHRTRAATVQAAAGPVGLPFDRPVATVWGQLQARAQLRGRPRPVNDTWIAACCLVNGLPLATFNTKDFVDFAQYEGLTLLDVA